MRRTWFHLSACAARRRRCARSALPGAGGRGPTTPAARAVNEGGRPGGSGPPIEVLGRSSATWRGRVDEGAGWWSGGEMTRRGEGASAWGGALRAVVGRCEAARSRRVARDWPRARRGGEEDDGEGERASKAPPRSASLRLLVSRSRLAQAWLQLRVASQSKTRRTPSYSQVRPSPSPPRSPRLPLKLMFVLVPTQRRHQRPPTASAAPHHRPSFSAARPTASASRLSPPAHSPLTPRSPTSSLCSDCFHQTLSTRFSRALDGARTLSAAGFDAYASPAPLPRRLDAAPTAKVVVAFSGGTSSRCAPAPPSASRTPFR